MPPRFAILRKEIDIQIHEAQKINIRINPKKSTMKHIVIKLSRVKESILESGREKRHTRGTHKIVSRFLSSLAGQEGVEEYFQTAERHKQKCLPKTMRGEGGA